jgi:hypothetical protein
MTNSSLQRRHRPASVASRAIAAGPVSRAQLVSRLSAKVLRFIPAPTGSDRWLFGRNLRYCKRAQPESVALMDARWLAAVIAEENIDHADVAKHVILIVEAISAQWIELGIMFDGINLGDKRHWFPAIGTVWRLVALDPFRLATQLRAPADVIRIIERNGSLSWPHAFECNANLG